MNEKSQPIFDLDSLDLDGADLVIDPNADPDLRPIPPDGRYVVKLGLNENSGAAFTAGPDRRGRSYVMANLSARVLADGKPWHNARIFDSRSTLVLDSSGTCGMAAVLRALKVGFPATTTKQALAKLLKTQLASEPLVGVELRWESRYQREDGTWTTFRKGMRKYPPRLDESGQPTGEFIPEVEAPDGQLHAAKPVVVRYLPVEEVR